MSYNDTKALKALIQTVTELALKTFVSKAEYPAPNQTVKVLPPYVVIHPSDGRDESDRVTGPKIIENPRFVIHSVGLSGEQAQLIGGLVKAKLVQNGLGVVMSVSGRRNRRLWYSSPLPVQVDASVVPALPFHVAECGWVSEPA